MIDETKKILLVEDDTAIADIYQTMMKKEGLNVEVIKLGQEVIKKVTAIKAGEQKAPVLILLDLILPDMNGMDVLKEIKSHDETKNIKVFILTNQEEASVPHLDQVTPDKFIIKANITPTQLLETIKTAVV